MRDTGRDTLEAEAAVYGQDLTGDEVWACREEEYSFGYVLGGSVAAHWGFGGEVSCFPARLQLDISGGYAVDADLWGEGFGHGLGKHMQSRFRSTVVGMRGPG